MANVDSKDVKAEVAFNILKSKYDEIGAKNFNLNKTKATFRSYDEDAVENFERIKISIDRFEKDIKFYKENV
jgi:hypothetical protein